MTTYYRLHNLLRTTYTLSLSNGASLYFPAKGSLVVSEERYWDFVVQRAIKKNILRGRHEPVAEPDLKKEAPKKGSTSRKKGKEIDLAP